MAEMIVKEATDTSVNPTISYASNAPQILGVDGFFMALALVTVVARIYVRTVMLKTFGADDYIICISMVNILSVPEGAGVKQLKNFALLTQIKKRYAPF